MQVLGSGKNMKELLGAGIVFVVLAVALMIGGAMIAITENITLTIAPTSTLISTLATNAGTALTTLTSMLPIVALALDVLTPLWW